MSEADLADELEIERELEPEQMQQMPPDFMEDSDGAQAQMASAAQLSQADLRRYQLHNPIDGLLRRMRGWKSIEVQNEQSPGRMPLIGCKATDGTTVFAPTPKSLSSRGNVLACAAPMGTGKSTMIRNFIRSTITVDRRRVCFNRSITTPERASCC
jgi:hypothetical protein